jgi:hypothetical protein
MYANGQGLQGQVRAKAFTTFFNVDGEMGKLAIPNPHRCLAATAAYHELDSISVTDRMKQISSQLTETEMAYLRAACINMCGQDLSKMSFFDCMRWWALGGYTPEGIDHGSFTFKLRCGHMGLSRAIFEDVASHTSFSYAFKSPISKLTNRDGVVVASTTQGDRYTAKKVISTIPWSVLSDITFEPPLAPGKAECLKNVNMGNAGKIWAEVKNTEWDAWSHVSATSELTGGIQYLTSGGATPAGNSTFVTFSLREATRNELFPDESPEEAVAAFQSINPQFEIQKLVSRPVRIHVLPGSRFTVDISQLDQRPLHQGGVGNV